MASGIKVTCEKCGKTKGEIEFFKKKDGERYPLCKHCLNYTIHTNQPETFLWILEKFNVPYIEGLWVATTNDIYLKNPAKYGSPEFVPTLGTYLRKMNMVQYKKYGYEDSAQLSKEYDSERQNEMLEAERTKEKMQILQQRVDNGEISAAEAYALAPDTKNLEKAAISFEQSSAFAANVGPDEDNLRESLSEEDIQYLALKWGSLYKPSQWIYMEDLYNKYAQEYELNTDREETLRKICKTSLKMDEALDVGDTQGFKALSGVYDQLRKSGKFTEAQNKEEQVRELDSIGELVKFVEREGGIIPQYDDPIDYPKDKVDFTIKDIKNYIDHLVRDELGLADLIESYIKKVDEHEESTAEDIMANSFKDEDESLTLEEVEEFEDFLAQEIEEEASKLLEEMGEL